MKIVIMYKNYMIFLDVAEWVGKGRVSFPYGSKYSN